MTLPPAISVQLHLVQLHLVVLLEHSTFERRIVPSVPDCAALMAAEGPRRGPGEGGHVRGEGGGFGAFRVLFSVGSALILSTVRRRHRRRPYATAGGKFFGVLHV